MLLRYGRILVEQEDWELALRVLQAALLQQSKLEDKERGDLFYQLDVCGEQPVTNEKRGYV